ncbi:hypothetical protein [Enterobacter sp. NFIX58]|uniref:hypothetical protein n=1 Tax=Enterobacter sp. NFIX58 TaxID=1566251 RepID=UPI0008BE98FD|nr:hypothetical protein [Enterobacter sp. NFIX58]SEO99207.1 hypothetical protein SAMN03159286_2598 [Enterobacter sp. NFIX58]
MSSGPLTSRRQFLNDIQAEQHSDALRSGKVWLATQRMLKRTGRVFVSDKTDPTAPGSVFDFNDVRDLYLLQLAASWIKNAAGFSSWVEISPVHKRSTLQSSLGAQYMIIPRSVRRKVDAYRQINAAKHMPVQEFKGSLYAALSRAFGSKTAANEKLRHLPSTPEEIRRITDPDIKVYGMTGEKIAPSFILFTLECKRLGYSTEHDLLWDLFRIIKDKHMLNSLGDSLFFTFLYPDDGDFFSCFIREHQEQFPSLQAKRDAIRSFVHAVHTRYLFTANKRNYLKRKKKKWSE